MRAAYLPGASTVIDVPEERSESVRSVGVLPSPDLPLKWTDARPFDGYKLADEAGSLSPAGRVPSPGQVISVAVIDEHSFTRESIAKSLQELCNVLDLTPFATIDGLLQSTKNFDLVLYHAHEGGLNRRTTEDRLASVKKVLPIAPVIILCDVDSLDFISAAFDSGVRGFIPTVSTTLELAIQIMYLVKVGGTFMPPSLSLRSSHDRVATQLFTPRQMAVLDRLKQGKPNKVIAFELAMSESSVKAHIQNIMKKMKVTNRTEAACRARELEIRAARSTD
jgi:DNA-binding NarL/FixJ family response regulator